jgi:hypothetical protein
MDSESSITMKNNEDWYSLRNQETTAELSDHYIELNPMKYIEKSRNHSSI